APRWRRGASHRLRLADGPPRPGPADVTKAAGLPRWHLLLAVPVALAADLALHVLPRAPDRLGDRPGHHPRLGPPGLADQGFHRGSGAAGTIAVRAPLAFGVDGTGGGAPGC